MFQEESATLLENVFSINLHGYKQTYLYPMLNGYGENGARKNVFFLQFHVPYLYNMKLYAYTAQSIPLADSQATPYRGECAMESTVNRKGVSYETSSTPVFISFRYKLQVKYGC